jgi:hypothetical protein
MSFGLWILAGMILFALGFCLMVWVEALNRKAQELARRRLARLAKQNASGLEVFVTGRGWVPADGGYHGR